MMTQCRSLSDWVPSITYENPATPTVGDYSVGYAVYADKRISVDI